MGLDRRKLMWLAGYPHSGAEWLRHFLMHYLLEPDDSGKDTRGRLARMARSDADSRAIAREAGRPITGLDRADTFRARDAYLSRLADLDTPSFVETCQARTVLDGIPVIPPRLSRCAIYVVRNPLDVVASVAADTGLGLDEATALIARKGLVLNASESHAAQFLGTWSTHVRSWFATDAFPVQVLRYEDMLADPEKSFTAVVETIVAPFERSRLVRAIEASAPSGRVAEEAQAAFRALAGTPACAHARGAADDAVKALPDEIAERIRADHGTVMKVLKYT